MSGYIPEAHPDLSCPTCHEVFIVTGETPIARERAIRDWRCPCTPETPEPAMSDGDVASSGHNLLGRLLSGRPGWVLRRAGVAW